LGRDPTLLGCWCWTRFRGHNNYTLKIFCAYCPNPPTDPLSTYSQQRSFFLQKDDLRCPRGAFIEDIAKDSKAAQEMGDDIILTLDGNMNMKNSMALDFKSLHLKETVLDRHGLNGPSTFRRNKQGSAIDGIRMSTDAGI
jgi:hypothetical protein